MKSTVGTVSKIKILSYSENPLVRFTLTDPATNKKTNCLIHHHSLSFLADVVDGSILSVFGYANPRHQFIVQKYAVNGKTSIQYFFETSNYPAKSTH